MPRRKTDRLHQRDHSDSDPQAGMQAPSVEEWTVEQWKRVSLLAALRAHVSKISPRCLEPPSKPETHKPAAALQHISSMPSQKRSRGRPPGSTKEFDQFGRRDQ